VARPLAGRMGAIAATLNGVTEPSERDRLAAHLARLQRRATMATMMAVGFGIIAASGMAIARYV